MERAKSSSESHNGQRNMQEQVDFCKIFCLLGCQFCFFLVWFLNGLNMLSGMHVYFYLSKATAEVVKLIGRIYSCIFIHSPFYLRPKIPFLSESPNYPRFNKKMTGYISVIVFFSVVPTWNISLSCSLLMHLPLWHFWKAGDSELANGGTLGLGQSSVVLDITNTCECPQMLSTNPVAGLLMQKKKGQASSVGCGESWVRLTANLAARKDALSVRNQQSDLQCI